MKKPDPDDILIGRILAEIRERDLFGIDDKLLLALSGGLDSVVLFDILQRWGYRFYAAHVNYRFRGEESEGDEAFVRRLCQTAGIPLHLTRNEAGKSLAESGESLQEAARQYRYRWFESLSEEFGYDRILTAHHLDDDLETALLHMLRGSGLRGISGIPWRRNKVVRPMLSTPRDEIRAYASRHKLAWREDRTNRKTDYRRNKIRHLVLPVLREIQPGWVKGIGTSLDILKEERDLLDMYADELKQEWTERDAKGRLAVRLPPQEWTYAGSLLYYLLRSYGFNRSQVRQMMESGTGAVFKSDGYTAFVDRGRVLIREARDTRPDEEIAIASTPASVNYPGGLLTLEVVSGFTPTDDPDIEYLSMEKCRFPLRLRKWKAGDRFCPLGMGGKHRKVKDYLTDRKVPLPDKDNCWVLLDAEGEIVWLAGMRLDERVKVMGGEKKLLKITRKG